MSKFFDFCDKKRKILCFGFSLVLLLFLFVPLARAGINGKMTDAPYFVSVFSETWYTDHIFSSYSYAPYYTLRVWRNILSTLFLCAAIIWLVVSCILIWANKKPRLGVFFTVCLTHFFLFAIKPNSLSISDERPLFDFELSPNFYYILILFFLYIVYLLLRRYYAPVKARIQASRAERQATRKPTKDERIAELERKVAELESKGKDEQ